MLNKVVLIGYLTGDVELKETASNIPYTYFTLAVNRAGNEDTTDFVSCVAWRGTAELMAKYLNKGSLIAIDGRLEVYRTEKDGSYETRTNVNVQNITFLPASKKEKEVEQPTQAPQDDNGGFTPHEETPVKKGMEIDFNDLKF